MKQKLVDEAIVYKNQGFRALKMKVGMTIEKDVEHVQAVRKAIGNDMELMIDSNHAYSLKEAVELARRVEDQNIGFFEEPISPEFYGQYSELRLRTSIPIAGGECEYLRHGFKTLLENKSVDIIQVQILQTFTISYF